MNRQPQQLVARVAVGGLRSGVRLQDPPVAAPDEKDDVTRVLGEQLVPVQDCLRTLPLADVDECADGPADAAVLVAQRHAVSEQRAHRPIVVDGREFLIAYVDAGPGRGINGQVAGANHGAAAGFEAHRTHRQRPGRGCGSGSRCEFLAEAVRGQRRPPRVAGDEHGGWDRFDHGSQLRGLLGRAVAREPERPFGRAPTAHLPRKAQ